MFQKIAKETGGEARVLESENDLLDVVCLQALDQVRCHDTTESSLRRMLSSLPSSCIPCRILPVLSVLARVTTRLHIRITNSSLFRTIYQYFKF